MGHDNPGPKEAAQRALREANQKRIEQHRALTKNIKAKVKPVKVMKRGRGR